MKSTWGFSWILTENSCKWSLGRNSQTLRMTFVCNSQSLTVSTEAPFIWKLMLIGKASAKGIWKTSPAPSKLPVIRVVLPHTEATDKDFLQPQWRSFKLNYYEIKQFYTSRLPKHTIQITMTWKIWILVPYIKRRLPLRQK